MPNFWDHEWNVVGGCRPVSPGCKNCYASQLAATQQTARGIPLYHRTTSWVNDRPVFNGKMTILERGHAGWVFPLKWPGARHPIMGPGKPSLIFCGDMSDLFLEDRPAALIRRVVETIGMSRHIGQLLTKRPARMVDFFEQLTPSALPHLQTRCWLGFSAERQREFDERWFHMRKLAARGWTVFACCGPMLAPIKLPADFLALRDDAWVIGSGEVCPGARRMDPAWPRALRDQCAAAGVPFFVLQMAKKAPIPVDLCVWKFPRVRD